LSPPKNLPTATRAAKPVLDLLLLRHADAVPQAVACDSQRPLSEFGRRQLDGLAERRGAELAAAGQWLVSPYLRTCQTHVALASVTAPLALCQQLTPDAAPGEAIAAIEAAAQPLLAAGSSARLVAVTHMPLIGELIEQLSGQRIGVPTAALTLIRFEIFGPQLGTLVWSDSR